MSVCGKEKCSYKRKPYPPGVHGKSFRRGLSEFGTQLMYKQRVKLLYGLRERQFQNYVVEAINQSAVPTSEAIVAKLEMRLDNVIYRLGFAKTRAAARQIVGHGHIAVNGLRVNIPSYQVKIGDEVKIMQAGKALFGDLGVSLKKYAAPPWLELNKADFSAKVAAKPPTDDLIRSYNLSSIVEYYSR